MTVPSMWAKVMRNILAPTILKSSKLIWISDFSTFQAPKTNQKNSVSELPKFGVSNISQENQNPAPLRTHLGGMTGWHVATFCLLWGAKSDLYSYFFGGKDWFFLSPNLHCLREFRIRQDFKPARKAVWAINFSPKCSLSLSKTCFNTKGFPFQLAKSWFQ